MLSVFREFNCYAECTAEKLKSVKTTQSNSFNLTFVSTIDYSDYLEASKHCTRVYWLGRKIIAIPASAFSLVVKTTHAVAMALFLLIHRDEKDSLSIAKKQLWKVIFALEETRGHLLTIFDTARGCYLAEKARYQTWHLEKYESFSHEASVESVSKDRYTIDLAEALQENGSKEIALQLLESLPENTEMFLRKDKLLITIAKSHLKKGEFTECFIVLKNLTKQDLETQAILLECLKRGVEDFKEAIDIRYSQAGIESDQYDIELLKKTLKMFGDMAEDRFLKLNVNWLIDCIELILNEDERNQIARNLFDFCIENNHNGFALNLLKKGFTLSYLSENEADLHQKYFYSCIANGDKCYAEFYCIFSSFGFDSISNSYSGRYRVIANNCEQIKANIKDVGFDVACRFYAHASRIINLTENLRNKRAMYKALTTKFQVLIDQLTPFSARMDQNQTSNFAIIIESHSIFSQDLDRLNNFLKPYDILELQLDAKQSDLKNATRKMQLTYRPDKHSQRFKDETEADHELRKQVASEKFKGVQKAYEDLKDRLLD